MFQILADIFQKKDCDCKLDVLNELTKNLSPEGPNGDEEPFWGESDVAEQCE